MERKGSCRLVLTENRGVRISEAKRACRGPVTTEAAGGQTESDPYGARFHWFSTTADGPSACWQGELA